MTQTSIKPFSSYPEDRERLRKLCDDVERDDDLSAAFALADLVGSILRDEEHLEEVTAEKRLRNAAPDLLAALRDAVEALDDVADNFSDSELSDRLNSLSKFKSAVVASAVEIRAAAGTEG